MNSKVANVSRRTIGDAGNWRAVCSESCKHGSERGGRKRAGILGSDTSSISRSTSLAIYSTNEKRRSEKVIKRAKGYARFKATITDGKGGTATGTKSECAASFPDYIEKAETGSIGRALAALGYGTQFAPELNEEHRIVDSPVERSTSSIESNDLANGSARKSLVTVRPAVANGNAHPATSAAAEIAPDTAASEQQLTSIRKLCEHLGKPEPENADSMSYASAKELIAQLSQEYRQSRSKAS